MNPRITPEEIGIIKRAKAGEELAFNMLFKKYKGFVDNLLNLYIHDIDEAKDITNIVFLKVHDKLSTFTAYDSFGGWLRMITIHTAIDYLRRIKKLPIAMESVGDRLPLTDSVSSNETELVNQFLIEEIEEVINSFPKEKRDVCRLFYFEGLTCEEISKTLRIPVGTIKSTLSRTRKRIQKHFKPTKQ